INQLSKRGKNTTTEISRASFLPIFSFFNLSCLRDCQFAACNGAGLRARRVHAAGYFHGGSGPSEDDGPVGHQGITPRPERKREGAEPRQLRRIQSESIPRSSRPAHAEQRSESNDRKDVVGPAPPRACGNV